jgi:hypothetical protein
MAGNKDEPKKTVVTINPIIRSFGGMTNTTLAVLKAAVFR